MSNKYNKLLFDKITSKEGFNLSARLNSKKETKFILKLLTYEHFIPLFIEEQGEYTKILEKEEKKLIFTSQELNTSSYENIANELKLHYKTKGLDQKYFLNLLTILHNDLQNRANAHIRFIPNSTEEMLNVIERKVQLTKSFRFYMNLTLIDRLQFNYNNNFQPFGKYKDAYTNKFIVKDDFDFDDYESLLDCCGCECEKLMRPLYEENGRYNYLPILCKRYCKNLAKIRYDILLNQINKCADNTNCELCLEMKEKFNLKEKQIKEELNILYFKTCPFSHNENEVIYHPLMFKTTYCDTQYTKEHDDKYNNNESICPFYHKETDINVLFNPHEFSNIYNDFQKFFPAQIKCPFPSIKTELCPIMSSPYKEIIFTNNLHRIDKCRFYHNEFEKRRPFSFENCDSICPKCIDDINKSNPQWKTSSDPNTECNENCQYYHTRNEILFNKRNYRRIYDCPKREYCDLGELCPYKHAIDIQVNELYLPNYAKYEIIAKINELKNTEVIINDIENKFLKGMRCVLCYEFPKKKMIVHKCEHILCERCGMYIQSCPICSLTLDYNSNRKVVRLNECNGEEYDEKIEEIITQIKENKGCDLENEMAEILNNSMNQATNESED